MSSDANKEPLVTIAVATYNGEQTIRDVLKSIVSIPYSNLEVLIGDDCSTDSTVKVCESFRTSIKNLQVFRSEKRLGINANYNRLLQEAKGTYYIIFDQDDSRDPTFIPKCVTKLEVDKNAVLCHSYTGVRWKGIQYHTNTLDSLVNSKTLYGRVFKLMRRPSDINIYGVIRTDALRVAGGWKPGLSNTNRLLFGLAIQGRYLQVRETLFWYTAKGLSFRPSNSEELERSQPDSVGRHAKLPGIRLLWGQYQDLSSSKLSFPNKAILTLILFGNFFTVNSTKVIYRLLWSALGERTPMYFTTLCSWIVYPDDDIQYIISRDDDPMYYPKEWPLRRIPRSTSNF